MKIRTSLVAVLILAVIFGGIGITSVLDLWSATSNRTPARYKDGAFADQYNPEDIRGSSENLINGKTTFRQLLDSGLTKEQIESALGTAMPAAHQTVKDFCLKEGLSFSTVKARLTGLLQP